MVAPDSWFAYDLPVTNPEAAPGQYRLKVVSSAWVNTKFQVSALVAISLLYLLQLPTPLRLDHDSVLYLQVAANLTDGVPPLHIGRPPAYPAFISLLDRIGTPWPVGFVVINCFFFAVGLTATWYLFVKGRTLDTRWLIPVLMLSFVLIKFVATPLPEAMFFGISLAALAVMAKAWVSAGQKRVALLVIALVLAIIATLVRLVGVALIPSLLFCCIFRPDADAVPRVRITLRSRILGLAAAGTICFVAAIALGESISNYKGQAGMLYLDKNALTLVVDHFNKLVMTVGELAVNVPRFQLAVYPGLFLACSILAGAWILYWKRITLPATPVGVYAASFLAILLLWPYNVPRLWMPLVPVLGGLLMLAPLRRPPTNARVVILRLYFTWIAFTGLVGLGFTSFITYSGSRFDSLYGTNGGMATPNAITGIVNEQHNIRARYLKIRYGKQ